MFRSIDRTLLSNTSKYYFSFCTKKKVFLAPSGVVLVNVFIFKARLFHPYLCTPVWFFWLIFLFWCIETVHNFIQFLHCFSSDVQGCLLAAPLYPVTFFSISNTEQCQVLWLLWKSVLPHSASEVVVCGTSFYGRWL